MTFTKSLTFSGDEVNKLLGVLQPFAMMDRNGVYLDELACERGVASDKTILTNRNFRKAYELYFEIKKSVQ
jgi:hypothetical protein